VAGTAGFGDTFAIDFRERILGVTNAVDAMTTHTIRRTRVFGLEQQLAVGAVLVLHQLIGGQGGIKPVHERRVGMAAGAERKHPTTIFVTATAGPFLDKGMFKFVAGGIATVAAGTRQSATKMNIIDQLPQVQVAGRTAGYRGKGKKRFGLLDFGIGVTQDAIILQKNLHLLRTQRQRQDETEVVSTRDDLRLRCVTEKGFDVIIQTIKISSLFRSDNRLAILALSGEQCLQFLRNDDWLFVCRNGRRDDAKQLANY